jgi:hypothetical protein
VARALKKDPEVRYQDAYELAADLRTCLLELQNGAPTQTRRDTTKTVKLAPKKGDSVPAKLPAAGTIAATTRLSLSRQFDSKAALKRLASASAALTRAPRRVGFVRRVCRDPGPRLLFASSLVAAAFTSYLVF